MGTKKQNYPDFNFIDMVLKSASIKSYEEDFCSDVDFLLLHPF